jgi:hypothetical protein
MPTEPACYPVLPPDTVAAAHRSAPASPVRAATVPPAPAGRPSRPPPRPTPLLSSPASTRTPTLDPLPLLLAAPFKSSLTRCHRAPFFPPPSPFIAHHEYPLPLGLWSMPVAAPPPLLATSRAAVTADFPLHGELIAPSRFSSSVGCSFAYLFSPPAPGAPCRRCRSSEPTRRRRPPPRSRP